MIKYFQRNNVKSTYKLILFDKSCKFAILLRGIAQSGSALRSGRRGRGFKSRYSDMTFTSL